MRLHEAGRSVEEIAGEMRLSAGRVRRLLDDARDRANARRDEYQVREVPNAPLRALFERRKAQDPDFSAAELARRARLSGAAHVERLLGIIKTSATVKNGRRYPGGFATTISLANAERLLRGMGMLCRDIEAVLADEEL